MFNKRLNTVANKEAGEFMLDVHSSKKHDGRGRPVCVDLNSVGVSMLSGRLMEPQGPSAP